MITQPILGRVADVYSYSQSFLVGAVIQLSALPFLLAAQREKVPTDTISNEN